MHCFASYDGVAFHHYWLADPKNVPNVRDAAYMTFDAGREVIKGYLAAGTKDDLGFECAIAWLAWICGFAVMHLGSKLREGPDIVAVTPSGHFAIVEVTTNVPSTGNKLSKLIQRVEALRAQLKASVVGPVRVIGVLVSALPASQIAGDIADGKKNGVLVLGREAVEEALRTTFVFQNPDQVYERAVQELGTS